MSNHKGGRKQIGVQATDADKARAKALGVSYGDVFLAGLDALEEKSTHALYKHAGNCASIRILNSRCSCGAVELA